MSDIDTSRVRNGKGHRAYRRQQAALRRRTKEQGLLCWICEQPIDVDLPSTEALSFTADHVEALTTGGHLLRNELRPAHRACNSRRGDGAARKHNHPAVEADLETEIWAAS